MMRCDNCGATLEPSVDGLSACPYCGAEGQSQIDKAALVGELMADRDGDGVPDVLEPYVKDGANSKAKPEATENTSWGLKNWIVLVLSIVAVAAFFIFMQLYTTGHLADP